MADFIQIGGNPRHVADPPSSGSTIIWLQVITLAWMLVECGVALYAASTARSPSMLAFGSDSLIELASASVVLLQFMPAVQVSERKAARAAAMLLYLLAIAVAAISLTSLLRHHHPETSTSGIVITIAALVAMPMLATLKRQEARRSGNAALAADAVQSATCAYLALTALAGVSINAVWHISWIDPAAALIAVPFLVREARLMRRGLACGCCC